MKRFQWLYFLLITLVSCVDEPEYPIEPVISLISIDKDIVQTATDSILIRIAFTDGDADLSFQDGYKESNLFISDKITNAIIEKYTGQSIDTNTQSINAHNVLLKDSRSGFIYGYNMPYIAPRGNGKNISGEIQINFKSLSCRPFIPPSPTPLETDTISLTIQILDRADHISNSITTPVITIDCVK